MNNDEGIKIPIVTVADTGGAKKQAEAIREVEKASREANAATKDGAKDLEEHGKNVDDAAKKTEFLNLKKTELKKLVRELGQQFPEAAMAARALMNPLVFSLTAVIGLFVKAKQALAEWNAKMDEAAKAAATREFLPGIEAKKQAMLEAGAAASTFAQNLANTGKAQDGFVTKTETAIAKLHEFIAAQAEVNSAGEAKELEEVNLQEKLGKISNIDAIKRRGQIREHYDKINDDLKTRGENEELALKQNEAAHLVNRRPNLAMDADQAAKALAENEERAAQIKGDLPGAKAKIDEKQSKFDEADKALSEMGNFTWRIARPERRKEETAKRQKAFEDAKRELDQQQRFVADMERQQRELTQDHPTLAVNKSLAEAKLQDNVNRSIQLSKEIETAKQTIPIKQKGRAETAKLKHETEQDAETEQLLATPEGEKVLQLSKDAKAIKLAKEMEDWESRNGQMHPQHDWITQQSAFAQKNANDLAGQMGVNSKQIGDLLSKSLKVTDDLAKNVGRAFDKLASLEQYIKNIEARGRAHLHP